MHYFQAPTLAYQTSVTVVPTMVATNSISKPSVPRISPDDMIVTNDMIGEGRFGKIFRGKLKDIDDEFPVVVKILGKFQ